MSSSRNNASSSRNNSTSATGSRGQGGGGRRAQPREEQPSPAHLLQQQQHQHAVGLLELADETSRFSRSMTDAESDVTTVTTTMTELSSADGSVNNDDQPLQLFDQGPSSSSVGGRGTAAFAVAMSSSSGEQQQHPLREINISPIYAMSEDNVGVESGSSSIETNSIAESPVPFPLDDDDNEDGMGEISPVDNVPNTTIPMEMDELDGTSTSPPQLHPMSYITPETCGAPPPHQHGYNLRRIPSRGRRHGTVENEDPTGAAPPLGQCSFSTTVSTLGAKSPFAGGEKPPLELPTKTRLKISIRRLKIVGEWKWVEGNEDNCGICRNPFEGCCVDCRMPGDDCPLVVGQCKHPFHMHCIVKWTNSQAGQQRPACPLCRQEWKFAS